MGRGASGAIPHPAQQLAVGNPAGDEVALAPHEVLDYWNEYGNTLRYLGDAKGAVEAYQAATNAIKDEEAGDYADQLEVLHRNLAIALREAR